MLHIFFKMLEISVSSSLIFYDLILKCYCILAYKTAFACSTVPA